MSVPHDGDEVAITWDGGNGPHRYVVLGEHAAIRERDGSMTRIAHLSLAREVSIVAGPHREHETQLAASNVTRCV